MQVNSFKPSSWYLCHHQVHIHKRLNSDQGIPTSTSLFPCNNTANQIKPNNSTVNTASISATNYIDLGDQNSNQRFPILHHYCLGTIQPIRQLNNRIQHLNFQAFFSKGHGLRIIYGS